ncbi:MAG: spore germination protein [Ruminococcaceae bacterium]|nr:spore germination protein [Oscillospiraceae bacterium]
MENSGKTLFDISKDYDQPVFIGENNFEKNYEYCAKLKNKSSDILIRKFTLADGKRCAVVSVDGMANKQLVEQDVILASRRFSHTSDENKFNIADRVSQMFGSSELTVEKSLSNGFISALTGDVLVIIEDCPEVYVLGYRAVNSRSVSESPNESSIRGPHEAFTENIRFNTALIRRRVADPNLTIEHLRVGRRSHTTVGLCYINGLTNPEIVNSIREQINRIDIDILNDSGELEQLLENQPSNIFPQCGGSELSDNAASALCSGRVVILVNGSPYALFLPVTLASLMKAPEDDYQRWSVASFVRILRWAALIIALIGPAFYVAVIAYNPGLLPTELLIISAKNRSNVPFSAVTEVLILELALEVLREAAIRMPKNVGTALSIVGGIIIGDAAIQAGLISPLLIIIIGITTMASFSIPSYSLASSFRLLKYFILALASILGVLGLSVGIILTVTLLASTQSYGARFTSPFMPLQRSDTADSLIELPIRKRTRRPAYCDPLDMIRADLGDE